MVELVSNKSKMTCLKSYSNKRNKYIIKYIILSSFQFYFEVPFSVVDCFMGNEGQDKGQRMLARLATNSSSLTKQNMLNLVLFIYLNDKER